ncbi:MAG: hypothetical protein K9J37_13635 [Saprospiraceae bacterium]|nr:hypothetical protein [Saprospiraceae bacterium]MCF8250951.1 hypothetical protein [Saprospiraceae bacterium]MCF8281928.1 hypothetical protein [Bacteroidales bacterium]MCF8311915.1 hypothetical protein [Saprospiraceae bacterium]MCF8441923.1 hypothetical protein [Saprospiraceae bacterium]
MSFPVSLASRFPVVGLSGSRRPSPSLLAAAGGFVSGLVSSAWSGVLVVGCAAGVDQVGRSSGLPSSRLRVFSVAGLERWQFAQRSAALVSALAAAGGCLVSFPGGPCPVGLAPCSVWRPSGGSGSWGSVCMALGLGVPVLLYSPGPVVIAPPAVAGRFVAVAGAAGWWVSASLVPVQQVLF